jgi:putative flippase GtrA
VSGLGILEIRYPHLLDNHFFPSHASGGTSGFIVTVLFFSFLKLSWNPVGGSIAIGLSLAIVVVYCARCIMYFLSNQQKLDTRDTTDEGNMKTWKQSIINVSVNTGVNAGIDYIQQQRKKRSKVEN